MKMIPCSSSVMKKAGSVIPRGDSPVATVLTSSNMITSSKITWVMCAWCSPNRPIPSNTWRPWNSLTGLKKTSCFTISRKPLFLKRRTGGYPAISTGISPDTLVAKVRGDGNKIGPAIVLKVMSCDKVDIGVSHFYRSGGQLQ